MLQWQRFEFVWWKGQGGGCWPWVWTTQRVVLRGGGGSVMGYVIITTGFMSSLWQVLCYVNDRYFVMFMTCIVTFMTGIVSRLWQCQVGLTYTISNSLTSSMLLSQQWFGKCQWLYFCGSKYKWFLLVFKCCT